MACSDPYTGKFAKGSSPHWPPPLELSQDNCVEHKTWSEHGTGSALFRCHKMPKTLSFSANSGHFNTKYQGSVRGIRPVSMDAL